jgi:hypothetical protein
MSKQTAVEFLAEGLKDFPHIKHSQRFKDLVEEAKKIEKKQLFLASNTSAKESYRAGQETMSCGCYKIADATTYEEWLYEQFKSEEE